MSARTVPARRVGPVTVHAAAGAAAGGGVGWAIVGLIVFVWPALEPVTEELLVLVVWAAGVLGTVLGGYIAPPGASRPRAAE